MRRLWARAAALVVVASASACTNPVDTYCDAKCACEGCSDVDHERCVAETTGENTTAIHAGCQGFFQTYLDCINANAVCIPGKHPTLSDDGECAREQSNYDNCSH